MPYIAQESRDKLLRKPTLAATPGELNFVITTIVNAYLKNRKGGPDYERYNAAIGVLECAKLELYRRKIADYEEFKIAEHGDVY